MRVRSLQELSSLPMHDHAKRQLEAQFKTSPAAHPAQRMQKTVTPNAGAIASQQSEGKSQELQDQLMMLVKADDQLRHYSWVSDYSNAVPGRKFEIDLCLPEWRLGYELDGWNFHGRRKKDFLRDREKDYLLSMAGWQIFRLQAGLLYKDKAEALRRMQAFLTTWLPRQQLLIESGHILPLHGSAHHSKGGDPS